MMTKSKYFGNGTVFAIQWNKIKVILSDRARNDLNFNFRVFDGRAFTISFKSLFLSVIRLYALCQIRSVHAVGPSSFFFLDRKCWNKKLSESLTDYVGGFHYRVTVKMYSYLRANVCNYSIFRKVLKMWTYLVEKITDLRK